ncbi:MAG TPA: hypothetical protein IAA04_08440 [Candidatus Lachnoclostridium pullistercoris]|uniref:Citrate transporter-like domain-containing protein n=1 Tax=Candidatus Lachnoclostridium pullistercoris TaxID=2838632 RepID=A0A9D2PDQ0_9FIRM|nr:hypothetical protein [Candidatus Lachnoclostridium pullistercoris]
MTTQIAIVLAIFLLFVILILSGKVKIHVAAMMIPIALEITGVLEFKDAWGGMLNNSVVMMASMFVVGAAIGKTNIINNLSKALIKPGASDFKIMCGIAVPMLFLGCFINATATMTIMIPMITAICAEQKRPLSKFMYPAAAFAQIWAGFLPTGGNAGGYLANNTIVENLGGVGTWNYFTIMISKIPAVVILLPLVVWLSVKIAPDNGNIPTLADSQQAAANASAKSKKRGGTLGPKQEKFVIFVFSACVIGIVVCALTGINTWYPSVIAALVLVFSGVLTDREAISAMGSPVIFITIGTLPLATALSSTGADVLLADVFNKLTGGLSPVMTMVLMYLVCCVLTQFITNSAVNNAFKMLAALICVQNGYDARALMLSTNEGSANCYLFPAAAPAMTMGFEAGGYTLKQHFKQGMYLTLLRFLCFVIYVPMIFPLV